MQLVVTAATIATFGVAAVATAPDPRFAAAPDPLFAAVLGAVSAAVNDTLAATPIGQYPGVGRPGGAPGWRTTNYAAWTSGFLPGMLWQLYNATSAAGDPASAWWLARAAERTAPLAPAADINSTHDLGFMVFTSFGAQWALTRDAAARTVALRAAHTLARRFVPAVGAFRSWGQPNPERTMQTIVDNMMNLELVLWAAAEEGNATLDAMARSHSAVTSRDFFQPWARGCVWHLAVYNDSSGALLSRTSTSGGLGTDTVWSQGQAWAVAGFALAYRYTREPAFLARARDAADCFVAATAACCAGAPRYSQPLWDFNATAPGDLPAVDTSAAAIGAAGLVELAAYVPPPDRARYLGAARDMLRGALDHWRFAARANDAVLANGTLLPDVGVATVWGDYYLLVAGARWAATPRAWRAAAAPPGVA